MSILSLLQNRVELCRILSNKKRHSQSSVLLERYFVKVSFVIAFLLYQKEVIPHCQKVNLLFYNFTIRMYQSLYEKSVFVLESCFVYQFVSFFCISGLIFDTSGSIPFDLQSEICLKVPFSCLKVHCVIKISRIIHFKQVFVHLRQHSFFLCLNSDTIEDSLLQSKSKIRFLSISCQNIIILLHYFVIKVSQFIALFLLYFVRKQHSPIKRIDSPESRIPCFMPYLSRNCNSPCRLYCMSFYCVFISFLYVIICNLLSFLYRIFCTFLSSIYQVYLIYI